jgi:hypothetical protein
MRKICTCEDSAGWTECGECGGALWISKVDTDWRDPEGSPPAKNGDYLTIRKTKAVGHFQDVLFYDTIHGWQNGIQIDGWMFLPEPPKESEG